MSTSSKTLFAKIGHDCYMQDEVDHLEKKYPEKSARASCRRCWCNLFLVSEDMCRSISSHLKSHGAVVSERERQLNHGKFIIHPYSPFRFYWDVVMILVSYIQLNITPIDAMLYILPTTFPMFSTLYFKWTRMTFDLICMFDVILNFITGYYDETRKEVVFDYKAIAKNYARGALVFDVTASVPTHIEVFTRISTYGVTMNILQGVSLLKICRYYILEQLYTKICNIRKVDYYVRQAIFIGISINLFWGILSCVNFFTVSMIMSPDRPEIIREDVHTAIGKAKFLTRQLYNGALLINGVSYGLYLPNTTFKAMNRVIFWTISRLILIYILARVIEYLNARTAASRKYKSIMQLLTEFMRHKRLPMITQNKIKKYYEYHFQKSYYNEKEIMTTISGQLRQEIVMHNCRQLVENVKFFKSLPLTVLVRIVSFLHLETYMVNDVICRSNTVGNCMYFISSGTVAIYTTSGKEICHLYDGDYFGEVALVTEDSMRVATVLAVEVCDLYRLDRKDFIKAIHPYPDLLDLIRKVAAERREDALEIDVKFRRQSRPAY